MDRDRSRTDGLDTRLVPFLGILRRKTRRTWTPLSSRGLLDPRDRKSLQSMAAQLGLLSHDQLQHFIDSPSWHDRPF